jgi:hypothetical protein
LSNLTIVQHLKKRNFPKEVRDKVLPILEKYPNNIIFVRDISGLRDVLYFEEKGMEFYDFPLFVSLNTEVHAHQNSSEDASDNYSELYNNAVTDATEIQRQLETFLRDSNRPLFVEIAFTENVLNNDDMWSVFHRLLVETDASPILLMKELYSFPDWYEVKENQDFALLEDTIFYLHTVEAHLLIDEIIRLQDSIDHLLLNSEFEKIKETKDLIVKLENQLNLTLI